MGQDSGKLRATRTNAAAAKVGAVVKVSSPPGTSSMWDVFGEGSLGPLDMLAPMLRSAWQARSRAVRVFGTMLGTAEIMQMLFANCDQQFVAWFARREVTPEEQQAFEEFLFDIPYESLQRVRFRMMEDGLAVVDRAKVEEYLGLAPGAGRLFLLGTASLSVMGYEHNRSEPVIRLWDEMPREPRSGSVQTPAHR